MKKLLLLFLFLSISCKAQVIQNDKLLHMGGSYVISSGVTSLVYNKTNNKEKSIIVGLAVSLLVGGIKELCDKKQGDSDWNDMLANTLGASLGVATIRIAI